MSACVEFDPFGPSSGSHTNNTSPYSSAPIPSPPSNRAHSSGVPPPGQTNYGGMPQPQQQQPGGWVGQQQQPWSPPKSGQTQQWPQGQQPPGMMHQQPGMQQSQYGGMQQMQSQYGNNGMQSARSAYGGDFQHTAPYGGGGGLTARSSVGSTQSGAKTSRRISTIISGKTRRSRSNGTTTTRTMAGMPPDFTIPIIRDPSCVCSMQNTDVASLIRTKLPPTQYRNAIFEDNHSLETVWAIANVRPTPFVIYLADLHSHQGHEHAITPAYFNQTVDNLKHIAPVLLMVVGPPGSESNHAGHNFNSGIKSGGQFRPGHVHLVYAYQSTGGSSKRKSFKGGSSAGGSGALFFPDDGINRAGFNQLVQCINTCDLPNHGGQGFSMPGTTHHSPHDSEVFQAMSSQADGSMTYRHGGPGPAPGPMSHYGAPQQMQSMYGAQPAPGGFGHMMPPLAGGAHAILEHDM